jgi:hypothetical protein
MSLPANITPVSVVAEGWTGPDGTGWNGVVLFATSGLLVDAGEGVIDGTATGTLVNGVMPAVQVVPTDCAQVSPTPFTYTITVRLQSANGSGDDQVFTGINIPAASGPTVDLSTLLAA